MPCFPESVLLCPVCRDPLRPEPAGSQIDDGDAPLRVLRCGRGHRFDAARQGYFNLLTGRGTAFEPDTAAMAQARIDFLNSGHFEPLAETVCAVADELAVDCPTVLDVGAGTGYYLGAVQERVLAAEAVALDISKFALRRAARLLPGVLCLVWDVWRPLPIVEGSVDLLLNVFAPRNPAEFARVCRDGGVLLVVTPLPHHLREIAEVARLLEIRPGKEDDVTAAMADSFELVHTRTVEYAMTLSPVDVRNVAAMGPAGHHAQAVELDSLSGSRAVTAAFTVRAFRRRARTGSQVRRDIPPGLYFDA